MLAEKKNSCFSSIIGTDINIYFEAKKKCHVFSLQRLLVIDMEGGTCLVGWDEVCGPPTVVFNC